MLLKSWTYLCDSSVTKTDTSEIQVKSSLEAVESLGIYRTEVFSFMSNTKVKALYLDLNYFILKENTIMDYFQPNPISSRILRARVFFINMATRSRKRNSADLPDEPPAKKQRLERDEHRCVRKTTIRGENSMEWTTSGNDPVDVKTVIERFRLLNIL